MTRFHPAAAAIALVTGLAFTTGAAHAGSQIGDNTTISAKGTVDNQLALAVGVLSAAHNTVGGVTVVGDLNIGKRVQINASGTAKNQLALAVGVSSTASNNVGGIMVIGTR